MNAIESTREGLVEAAGRSLDTVHDRGYDRIRRRVHHFLSARGTVAGVGGAILLLAPDLIVLMARLLRDSRVPKMERALLAGALVYYLSPLELVPVALFGPVGVMEDVLFGVWVLNRVVSKTDPEVLRGHWSGSEDILSVIQRLLRMSSGIAGTSVIKRLRRLRK